MRPSDRRARSLLARLAPFVLAVAALPLLAPTCGGQSAGTKVFSKGSIVIPMDACYQGNGSASPVGCPGASQTGDVIKAYGLAYQLIKAGIPVYWVIANGKSSLTGVDATISFASGSPVGVYDWNGGTGGMPANNTGHSIDYRGGPFVIDGTDAAAAVTEMQKAALKSVFGTPTPHVNVHVSTVAFSAYVKQVFAGGWSAGGSVAPKLALLNIGSNNAANNDAKNSFGIIQSYLTNAGLNTGAAGGVATDTGHGEIYDALYMTDFQPGTTGTWTSSNLGKYGYQVLWVPHWWAPGSCADSSSNANCTSTKYPAGQIANVLGTVGGFVTSGRDLMAECAGLGSFEGVVTNSDFGAGNAASQFQAPAELAIQARTGTVLYSHFDSPLMQIGDFPFTAQSGAIENYEPNPTSVFRANVQQLVYTGANSGWSYFTFLPKGAQGGNVAYLAGHDYSSGNSAVNHAGERLVLNTLFNLSGGCKPRQNANGTPMACTQSKNQGTCAAGTWQCCTAADVQKGYCSVSESSPGASDGEPVCRPVNDVPGIETCNNLDDDCDGIVDNHLTDPQATTAPHCYPGAASQCAAKTGATCPAGTTESGGYCCKGVCHPGTWSCGSGSWSCIGAGLPGTELCNGLDDNCDGTVDEASGLVPPGGSTPGQAVACYTGPTGTAGVGLCRAGTWACQSATWVCNGQVLPAQERCEGALQDYNCNGTDGDGCACVPGTTQPCGYPTYPTGHVTPGVGICRAGTQTCLGPPGGEGTWGACQGQVLPHTDGSNNPTEICGNGLDDDCNGIIDDPAQCDCQAGDTQTCYPAATAGCVAKAGTCPGGTTERDGMCCTGVCAPGARVCVAGKYAPACTAAVTPATVEKCNGKNDTCSAGWVNDDAAPCPSPLACVNGVCTRGTLSGEGTQCQAGYVPQGPVGSQTCVPASCPDATPPHVANTPCPPGSICLQPDAGHPNGTTCVDPCAGKTCADGAYCSGGSCVGGGCTGVAGACGAGQVCRNGACQNDPCAATTCPSGTFCRGNFGGSPPVADCVRPCAAVVCPYGQACGSDGFCAPDACATVACAAGQVCKAGACVADPCPAGACGAGQMCVDGLCVDDPCDAIACPTSADQPPASVGVCVRGQCQALANPGGFGPPPSPTASTKSGCGCGGGDAAPTSLLLALLALPLARRRPRRPAGHRGPALLSALAALLLLGGTACSKSKAQKPDCQTCGGDACVDVATSAANCGACGRACGAGYACGDGRCLTAAVVPAITGVTPSLVFGRAQLTVTGTDFAPGALVRALDAVPQTTVPASGVTATQLQATVDLTAVAAGTLRVQVLNPDGAHPNTYVTSNLFALSVVTPTPTIASLVPAQGPAGTTVPVQVNGTNFTSNAVCVQKAAAVETVIVPRAGKTSTQLTCDLDLSGVAPGFLDVQVQNENNVRSAASRFEAVSPGVPAVTSLSPSSAIQGSELKLLVTGLRFVPGATVEIAASPSGPWTPLVTDYVYSSSLRATLSLKTYAAGTYQVHVVAPGGTSNASPFTVAASAPVATLLSVNPATPVLGQTSVGFTLTGAGFSPGCLIQIAPPPGSTFRAVDTPGAVTASQVQGGADLDQGGDTFGTWNARASCTTGCGSPPCLTAALPFTVVTNQATLLSVAPAGAEQGSTAAVTLAGANFLAFPPPGMTVTLDGGAAVPATVTSATGATVSLPLAGVNTGVHLLRAVNAGAAASNPIAFSVTPGTPSITGVAVADFDAGACTPSANCSSCAGATCANPGACAVQQAKRAQVTVSGANFGTGVSTVFVSSVLTGKVDLSTVLPAGAVTVVDATTIRVTLDTTAVLAPQTYGLTVENPGKAPSATVPFKVSTTTCP